MTGSTFRGIDGQTPPAPSIAERLARAELRARPGILTGADKIEEAREAIYFWSTSEGPGHVATLVTWGRFAAVVFVASEHAKKAVTKFLATDPGPVQIVATIKRDLG